MIHSATARVKAATCPQDSGDTTVRRIPFSFRADPVALDELRLPRTARQVFVLLLDNARGRGWKSRLSNGVMARILGCCEMTIGRALVALEKVGLIRRDLIAGGRVRLAIHVVWSEVQQPCGTERPCVQQERGTGSTPALEEVQHRCGTNQSAPSERENQTGGVSPGFRTNAIPAPAAGAAYLAACVAAAKRGEPMPEPPGFANCESAPPKDSPQRNTPSPSVPGIHGTSPATPTLLPGASLAQVGRMVASLGDKLKADGCGPRRVGPARLARQLGEMRRRHAKGTH